MPSPPTRKWRPYWIPLVSRAKLLSVRQFSEEGAGLFRRDRGDGVSQRIYVRKALLTGIGIFDLLPLKLLSGQITHFSETNDILIGRSVFTELFGDTENFSDAVGVTLSLGVTTIFEAAEYTIRGVYEDLPPNYHLSADVLIFHNFHAENTLHGADSYNYIALEDSKGAHHQLEGIVDKFNCRPVGDIHLATDVSNNPGPSGSRKMLYFLACLGVIMMLLSITNYTNHAIFHAFNRAREIGIRKLLGIKPARLAATFFGEALLINLVALMISIVLFQHGLQWTAEILQSSKEVTLLNSIDFIAISEMRRTENVLFLLAVSLLSALLSGTYPAFYFKKLSSKDLLKGKLGLINAGKLRGASIMVRYLIIFQLAVAMFFLSAIYIVHKQRQLQKNFPPGFNLSVSGVFPGLSGANKQYTDQIRVRVQELVQQGIIRSVSYSNLNRGKIETTGTMTISPTDSHDNYSINLVATDPSFNEPPTQWVSGRNFDPLFGSNPNSLVLNEAALKVLGISEIEAVLDEKVRTDIGEMSILGVVSDEAPPTAYVSGFRYRTYIDLEVSNFGNRRAEHARFLHDVEVALSSPFPFFSLFRRDYMQQGEAESQLVRLFMFFTIVAIMICSFGLFALSVFVAEKRAKEIGLRKLLGASSAGVILVLFKDLVRLIVVAIFIALPFILISGTIWLETYPRRVTMGPLVILWPFLVILLISVTVIAKKCWRVAMQQPLDLLQIH